MRLRHGERNHGKSQSAKLRKVLVGCRLSGAATLCPVLTGGCGLCQRCSGAGMCGPLPVHPFSSSENAGKQARSEEHTSELQSLMRISYAVFCLKKKLI